MASRGICAQSSSCRYCSSARRKSKIRSTIAVENPHGVCRGVLSIKLDDEMLAADKNFLVPLVDDGVTHRVQVVLGSS
jgi:predicted transcriptional regulator YheO